MLAVLNNEYTRQAAILPEWRNRTARGKPAYPPIRFQEHEELQVWGVVTGLWHALPHNMPTPFNRTSHAAFRAGRRKQLLRSCERVFNPILENRPVVGPPNNDGCAIARSNEVKRG